MFEISFYLIAFSHSSRASSRVVPTNAAAAAGHCVGADTNVMLQRMTLSAMTRADLLDPLNLLGILCLLGLLPSRRLNLCQSNDILLAVADTLLAVAAALLAVTLRFRRSCRSCRSCRRRADDAHLSSDENAHSPLCDLTSLNGFGNQRTSLCNLFGTQHSNNNSRSLNSIIIFYRNFSLNKIFFLI